MFSRSYHCCFQFATLFLFKIKIRERTVRIKFPLLIKAFIRSRNTQELLAQFLLELLNNDFYNSPTMVSVLPQRFKERSNYAFCNKRNW